MYSLVKGFGDSGKSHADMSFVVDVSQSLGRCQSGTIRPWLGEKGSLNPTRRMRATLARVWGLGFRKFRA